MRRLVNNPVSKFFFFGNYFYGICAIMLSIEATVQQEFPLNPLLYYAALFCVTVVFYTKAYIHDTSGYPSDERNAWYQTHRTFVRFSQAALSLCAFIALVLYFIKYKSAISGITMLHVFLFFIFPFTAAMYYGIDSRYNIRKFGGLKPFIIGFCWAGIVTWYPVLIHTLQNGSTYTFTLVGTLLFIKNFMFISVLCIMFDIKDYADDAREQLNTFMVLKGLKKTIFYIIIPLAVLGLLSFVIYGMSRHFHPMKILLNVIPFALMIWAAYKLKEKKGIMYYLVNIDGLMLIKGICGYVAMSYFSF